MQLDQQAIDEITRALGAIPQDDEPLRRRKSARYNVDREIAIKPYGVANASSRPAVLVNISAGGVNILDRVPISVGDQFIAVLPLPQGASREVICVARQSQLTPVRTYRVGAEFVSELERETRLVRGGVGAPPGPEELEPYDDRYRDVVMYLDDKAIQVEMRRATESVFEITSTQPVNPGDQVILTYEIDDKREAWHCHVMETRDLPREKCCITLQKQGPADMSAREAGWLRRFFRRG